MQEAAPSLAAAKETSAGASAAALLSKANNFLMFFLGRAKSSRLTKKEALAFAGFSCSNYSWFSTFFFSLFFSKTGFGNQPSTDQRSFYWTLLLERNAQIPWCYNKWVGAWRISEQTPWQRCESVRPRGSSRASRPESTALTKPLTGTVCNPPPPPTSPLPHVSHDTLTEHVLDQLSDWLHTHTRYKCAVKTVWWWAASSFSVTFCLSVTPRSQRDILIESTSFINLFSQVAKFQNQSTEAWPGFVLIHSTQGDSETWRQSSILDSFVLSQVACWEIRLRCFHELSPLRFLAASKGQPVIEGPSGPRLFWELGWWCTWWWECRGCDEVLVQKYNSRAGFWLKVVLLGPNKAVSQSDCGDTEWNE